MQHETVIVLSFPECCEALFSFKSGFCEGISCETFQKGKLMFRLNKHFKDVFFFALS